MAKPKRRFTVAGADIKFSHIKLEGYKIFKIRGHKSKSGVTGKTRR